MNYLAHIFLSGNEPPIRIGNFIGDAVKGSSYTHYPQAVADGILLHRAIDSYTDSHPAVRGAVRAMRPRFGRYSAILLDIYFDYLLASRFGEFSDVPLRRFARRFYLTMISKRRWLPARIKKFMWHFIGTDRLSRYATPDGIRDSLNIMTRTGRIAIPVDEAIGYMLENEEELLELFRPFFAGLQLFCHSYIAAKDRSGFLKEFGMNGTVQTSAKGRRKVE